MAIFFFCLLHSHGECPEITYHPSQQVSFCIVNEASPPIFSCFISKLPGSLSKLVCLLYTSSCTLSSFFSLYPCWLWKFHTTDNA